MGILFIFHPPLAIIIFSLSQSILICWYYLYSNHTHASTTGYWSSIEDKGKMNLCRFFFLPVWCSGTPQTIAIGWTELSLCQLLTSLNSHFYQLSRTIDPKWLLRALYQRHLKKWSQGVTIEVIPFLYLLKNI